MFKTVCLVAGFCTLLIAGCGGAGNVEPVVKTIPVTGQVVDVSGKPVVGGMLSLRSITNAEQVASAKIDPQGAFKLTSLVGEKRVDGAQPGEYSVLFAPDTIKQTDQPVMLKKTYVIGDGQTELKISLE